MTSGVQAPSRSVAAPVHGPTVGLVAQLALVVTLAATVGLTPAGWLAATAYAVVSWAALTLGLRRYRSRALGPANRVTLVRATLIVGVTALAAGTLTAAAGTAAHVVLVTLAAVALVLDGVDGFVARRTGSSSPLGARFDMETDAFLILVLSALVGSSYGWWVLAIGGLRYVFVAAAWALPWLRAPLPPRFSRKTVAAVQGVVLVVAASGLVWRPLALAAVASALALLLWSFGRDTGWLWRHRPGSRAVPDRPGDPATGPAGLAFGPAVTPLPVTRTRRPEPARVCA